MGSPDRDLQHAAYAVIGLAVLIGGAIGAAVGHVTDVLIHRHHAPGLSEHAHR